MPVYAMIDSNSGYFWGAVDAPEPIAACRTLDAKIDPQAASFRRYEEVPHSTLKSGADGYYVHHIDDVTDAAAVDAQDGQDPTTISIISAYPLAAVVRVFGAPDVSDD